MGWSIGYDEKWSRDIGYGVPAECDHPRCDALINRGLGYVCGAAPYGGEKGCGLYFCGVHQVGDWQRCPRCAAYKAPYKAKPDIAKWVEHQLTDSSWQKWRDEQGPEALQALRSNYTLPEACK